MSDPKVLADALVEAGIADKLTLWEPHSGYAYQFPAGEPANGCLFLADDAFINDWRVAGKVLESAHMAFIEKHGRWQVRYDKAYGNRTREWHSDESLPRAIIEAWYAAQEENDDYDPTPYCHVCGAMTKKECDCPDPFYADNH
jgi:hypothetical protein